MTQNHQYNTPAEGEPDWNIPLNENFERIDTDVEIRDVDQNRSQYEPKDGAKFLATDTGEIHIGNGTDWEFLGQVPNSTGTSETNAGAQSLAAAGYVVPVAADTGPGDAIDPATTSTPVQDALDRIGASNAGTVLLPPTTVTEGAPLTHGSKKSIIGFGPYSSQIKFTNDTHGIMQAEDGDWAYSLIRGVYLHGNDSGGGSAIYFDQHFPAQGFNLDLVFLQNWFGSDPIIHFAGSHTFDFHWSSVFVNGYGVPFKVDHAGTHGRIDHMLLVTYSDDPAFQVTGTYPEWSIGGIQSTNADGNAVYDLDIGNTGSLTIGQLKYEPVVENKSIDTVVRKSGSGYLSVDSLQTAGSYVTTNHLLRDTGSGNWKVTAAKDAFDGATLNGKTVKVDSSSDRPCIYGGHSGEVDGPGVSCLQDLTRT
jgi:hypothetical protein